MSLRNCNQMQIVLHHLLVLKSERLKAKGLPRPDPSESSTVLLNL